MSTDFDLVASTTALRKRRRRRRLLLKATGIILAFWLLLPPFVYPVRGNLTSGFFIRQKPEERIFMSLELHSGIDIAAPEGTVVRAAKSGRVRATGYTETAGQYVELVHLLGFTTYYSHLSRVETRDGAIRLKWSRVGRVGATGRATGSHLHFELRWLGLRLPPRPFLLFSGIRHRIGERIGL